MTFTQILGDLMELLGDFTEFLGASQRYWVSLHLVQAVERRLHELGVVGVASELEWLQQHLGVLQ